MYNFVTIINLYSSKCARSTPKKLEIWGDAERWGEKQETKVDEWRPRDTGRDKKRHREAGNVAI